VQVDLPGKPANSMAIEGLRADGRPGYQNVLVDMASRGNQMIKPTLDIEVKDDSGKRVLAKTTKLDTILPSTRIDYPVAVLGRGLAAGTYKGTVVLRLGGKILSRFSGSFNVTDKQVAQVFGNDATPSAPGGRLPWKTILAGALAALLAAAAALAIRSVRRRRAAAVELARLDLEAAESRLRDLEDRESGVAERERIDTVRRQLLEERGRDLDDIEQATADRACEVERTERVLGEREAEATARGQHIELSQIRAESTTPPAGKRSSTASSACAHARKKRTLATTSAESTTPPAGKRSSTANSACAHARKKRTLATTSAEFTRPLAGKRSSTASSACAHAKTRTAGCSSP
jgi:hypothetical protein